MFLSNYRCQHPSDRPDSNVSHIFQSHVFHSSRNWRWKMNSAATVIPVQSAIDLSAFQASVSITESQSSENPSFCLIRKVLEFLTWHDFSAERGSLLQWTAFTCLRWTKTWTPGFEGDVFMFLNKNDVQHEHTGPPPSLSCCLQEQQTQSNDHRESQRWS